MINLPAFSGAAFLATLLGDFVMLALFFLAAGPIFLSARDAFGRPLEVVSIFKRVVLLVSTIGFGLYLAVQLSLAWSFAPYFFDSHETATERITARTTYPPTGKPVARWITTETHRFGVTEDIFKNFSVGELVEFRFRPLDDTLYEIHLVGPALSTPGASFSPIPSPSTP